MMSLLERIWVNKKKRWLVVKFLSFLGLILFGYLLGSGKLRINNSVPLSSEDSISAKQLKQALENKDFVFINVHTPYEGEIAGTDSFIEYDSMKANEAQLPKDKSTPIILYCKSGRMSGETLTTLKDMGYTNVRHLAGGMNEWKKNGFEVLDLSQLPSQVLPDGGFELPISWGDMGSRLTSLGVIDRQKFEEAVNLTDSQKAILEKPTDDKIKIDASNSQFIVDMLWAYGLAQRSVVYEKGPMGTDYKDSVGDFASTGGWTLAKDDAMNYYNSFNLIDLSLAQQDRVYSIAQNIYRPCCGNHTAFPDCNHGMAALAAIELMVYKEIPDEEIYKNILKLNSFWFPQNYLMVATYFARQGTSWDRVDAKLALGSEYSSAQAASELFKKVGTLPYGGQFGGSCGA